MAAGAVGAAGYAAYAAMAAAAVYSAYSSVQSGKQAQINADAQADQAQNDADSEASAAAVQADRIRRLSRNQASEANAALAASGVAVGEGTAVNINEEIIGNGEEDAVLTFLNGQEAKRRGYVDSSNMSLVGSQARNQAYGQAAGTLLGTGASIGMDGWKATARNGKASSVGGNA
jgi:vacuolar-type H+-ATPase subunit H